MRSRDNEDGILGTSVVYVDDILVTAPEGEMRDELIKEFGRIWRLGKQGTLTIVTPLTFLGIDMYFLENGDLLLKQDKSINNILEKNNESNCNPLSSIQICPIADEPGVPGNEDLRKLQGLSGGLRKLQGHSGDLNWLATRTRADV